MPSPHRPGGVNCGTHGVFASWGPRGLHSGLGGLHSGLSRLDLAKTEGLVD